MIEVKSVKKTFRKRLALDIEHLSVEENQIMGLLGENGAGKSTLMRAIIGAIPIDSGNIHVLSKDVKKDSLEIKKNVGYVPEKLEAFKNLTGFEFIELIAQFYGMKSTTQFKSKVENYLEQYRFDPDEAREKQIEEYSTGMKKKVALISALIHSPPIIILDEPTSGLDPHAVHVLKTMLLDYRSNGGTIIVSSHIMDLIATICTNVAIIANGTIIHNSELCELINCDEQDKVSALEQKFIMLTK